MIYEVEYQGKVYEVDAESPEQAAAAFDAPAPKQEASLTEAPPPTRNPRQFGNAAQQETFGNTYADDVVDAGLTAATGALTMPFAGAAGIAGTLVGGNDTGVEWQNAVQELGTWSPKTKGGQAMLEGLGTAAEAGMNWLRPKIEAASRPDAKFGRGGRSKAIPGRELSQARSRREQELIAKGIDPTQSDPAMAAFLETGLLGTSEVIGAAAGIKAIRIAQNTKSAAYKGMEAAAAGLKINLDNANIRQTTVDAGREMSGYSSRATSGIEDLVPVLREAKENSSNHVNALYTEARSKNAGIGYEPLRLLYTKLKDKYVESGVDFSPGRSRRLKARLSDLAEINTRIIGREKGNDVRPQVGGTPAVPPTAMLGPDGNMTLKDGTPAVPGADPIIPLNEIELLLNKIQNDINDLAGAQGSRTEWGKLIDLRRKLNTTLNDQFDADMISGDPTAKQAWLDAKAAYAGHAERFNVDDAIVRLIEDKRATPTDMAKWIIGASETKHRPQAINTIRTLREILGPDDPKMESITMAVVADILDPLFKDGEPNFRAAIERVRKFRQNEPALLRAANVSEADLDILVRAMKAADLVITKKSLDMRGIIANFAAVQTAGHDLAKASMHRKMVNWVADRALGVGQKTHEQLLREFAGSDLDISSPIMHGLNDRQLSKIKRRAPAWASQQTSEESEDQY